MTPVLFPSVSPLSSSFSSSSSSSSCRMFSLVITFLLLASIQGVSLAVGNHSSIEEEECSISEKDGSSMMVCNNDKKTAAASTSAGATIVSDDKNPYNHMIGVGGGAADAVLEDSVAEDAAASTTLDVAPSTLEEVIEADDFDDEDHMYDYDYYNGDDDDYEEEEEMAEEEDEEVEVEIVVPDLPPMIDSFMDVGYGEPQRVTGDQEMMESTLAWIRLMHEYMHRDVLHAHGRFHVTADQCKNEHELCAFWASIDECDENPDYMEVSCAPACGTCELLHFDTRCPMPDNIDEMDVFKYQGELSGMFERIANDPQYNTRVIHREGDKHELTGIAPWVLVVDDFLTQEECEKLQELGAEEGYEISKDVGKQLPDGSYDAEESDGRTSTNAWCSDTCYEDPITKNVLEKLEKLTGIPDANAEYLQLLRYEPGQFYNRHHDFIDHNVYRRQGPRILTVFLYLNDVEAGGGTHFNDLKTTIQPKAGSALLWPSVRDHNLNKMDRRTHHEALPVEKGIKYGANAWYHLRDFKTPHAEDCI